LNNIELDHLIDFLCFFYLPEIVFDTRNGKVPQFIEDIMIIHRETDQPRSVMRWDNGVFLRCLTCWLVDSDPTYYHFFLRFYRFYSRLLMVLAVCWDFYLRLFLEVFFARVWHKQVSSFWIFLVAQGFELQGYFWPEEVNSTLFWDSGDWLSKLVDILEHPARECRESWPTPSSQKVVQLYPPEFWSVAGGQLSRFFTLNPKSILISSFDPSFLLLTSLRLSWLKSGRRYSETERLRSVRHTNGWLFHC
jgi:hypothetical protein